MGASGGCLSCSGKKDTKEPAKGGHELPLATRSPLESPKPFYFKMHNVLVGY